MYIKNIKLKNYRCYEELNLNFDKEYSVLVGVNGAGKSSILDAVATALGSYISGFDGIKSNGISHEDAHRKMYELGSRVESEEQYPVEIETTACVDDSDITWKRTLHATNGRTHIIEAKKIMNYGEALQEAVREGNKNCILPIVAYYGTGRLYMQKRDKKKSSGKTLFSRTKGYEDCLASASNDKQMMKWFEMMTTIQLQEGKTVPELEIVKAAMGKCYAGSMNQHKPASFEYKIKSNEIEITYEKNGETETLPMRMLSDGLKITISMVADIAYRMAVLNPQLLDRVLEETSGIVLIDEVEMHLHPSWQKRIVEDLHYIFPKVQFIMTTHSPSVLANVEKEHVLLLNDGQIYNPNNATYGRDINAILKETMETDVRPEEVVKLQDEFYNLLSLENYDAAKNKLDKLEAILGNNDAEIVHAKLAYDLEQI